MQYSNLYFVINNRNNKLLTHHSWESDFGVMKMVRLVDQLWSYNINAVVNIYGTSFSEQTLSREPWKWIQKQWLFYINYIYCISILYVACIYSMEKSTSIQVVHIILFFFCYNLCFGFVFHLTNTRMSRGSLLPVKNIYLSEQKIWPKSVNIILVIIMCRLGWCVLNIANMYHDLRFFFFYWTKHEKVM